MKGTDIVTITEAQEFTRIDYDESTLSDLIQIAFDVLNDSINDIDNKLKSAKFKRKLKLCILNYIVDMYNNRGVTTDKVDKFKYINQSMLLQLQYGTYLETDV